MNELALSQTQGLKLGVTEEEKIANKAGIVFAKVLANFSRYPLALDSI